MFALTKFELKKVYKKNIIYMVLILALVMAFYSYHKTSPSILRFSHEETSTELMYIYYNDVRDFILEVQAEDFDLAQKISQDFDIFTDQNESIRLKTESLSQNQDQVLSLRLDNIRYFKSLIDKYQIPLDKEFIDTIDYEIFRNSYSIENKIPLDSIDSLGARLFFFGVDYGLGPVPLFILIFFLSDLLTKEYEKDHMVLIKSLPKSFGQVLGAKFIAGLFMVVLYVLGLALFYMSLAYINGQDLGFLNNIFRIMDGSFSYIYLWQYFLICGGLFVLVAMSFVSLIFFLSFLFKDSTRVLLTSLSTFIIFYLLDLTNVVDFNFNPIKLLSFRDYILGTYSAVDSLRTFNFRQRIEPLGIKYYLLVFLLSCLAIVFYGLYQRSGLAKPIKNTRKTRKEDDIKAKALSDSKDPLLLFEFRKVNNSLSFRAFIGLAFAISFILHFSMEQIDQVNIENRLETFSEINYLNNTIESYEALIDESINIINNTDSPSLIDDHKETIGFYKASIDDLNKQKTYYQTEKDSYYKGDSKTFNENIYRLYPLRFPKTYANNYHEFNPENPSDASEFTKAISYANIRELNKRKIDPILGNDFLLSKYDIPIDSYTKDYYQNTSTPYTHNGLYSFYRGNDHYNISLIMVALIFIFLSGGYTWDKDPKAGIVLLYTQPVRRQAYQDRKYIFYIGSSLVLLVLFGLIWFVLGTIMDGPGQLNYPIVFYESLSQDIYNPFADFSEYFSFISIGRYVFNNFIMAFCILIYILSLSNLVSIFVKRKSTVLLITGLIIILGYLSTYLMESDLVMALNPLAYIDTGSVADGSIKIIMDNDRLTLLYGVLACAIFTIVNYIIEYILIEKVDVGL